MSVERGRDWGRHGSLPEDGVVVHGDAQARHVVETARRKMDPLPPLGLLGGDLCRTLGGRGHLERLRGPDAATFDVDLASALVDGRQFWFASHLVARRSWLRGRIVMIMNAEWLGRWDVAPRGHPGDGLLDILDADLALGQRLQARRRVATGTHVPHPGITQHRVAHWQTHFATPTDVWLDGISVGRARTISVRVEPEALRVVV